MHDAMSNIEETEKKMCKLEKSMEKSNNVANDYKNMEKLLIGLAGVMKKGEFLLMCIIFLVFFLGSVLFAKNWLSM